MAAAPAPAAVAPPLVLDAHTDTLDHVVRAVARSDFLPEAVRLMLASREHLHDPELLYRTRGVRGDRGMTLLMRAVERRDVVRAAKILGACPTAAARVELLACVDDDKWAALHIACDKSQRDEEAALRMVELLLANGADPLAPHLNSTGQVSHAIHHAAQWSARLVQRLVQAGASIDGDVADTSSLFAAAAAGSAQGVRMIPQLVALGARETRDGTAIFALARFPVEGAQPADDEVVAALDALVSVGCSLTQPEEEERWAPLENAAHFGNMPVVRALLSLGAPATSSSLAYGIRDPAIMRLLLSAGAPVDALVDSLGGPVRSPLMEAALKSVLESVEALLAAGASVGFRNDDGAAALHFSVSGKAFDPRLTEALLAAGADVNAQANNGFSTLHYLVACQQAPPQPWAVIAARLLLRRGANARALSADGYTPAQCVPMAQRGGRLHRLLLEMEAET